MLVSVIVAVIILAVGLFVGHAVGRMVLSDPPKGFRVYLTTHHYGSQHDRDEFDAYEKKIGMKKMKDLLSGKDAKCVITVKSKDHLMSYCYWYAKSSDAVRKQLDPLQKYYQDTEIEETSPMLFWRLL